jgi:hypothetical protein
MNEITETNGYYGEHEEFETKEVGYQEPDPEHSCIECGREELADLEHRQWMHWSKYVAKEHDIPEKLEEKWEKSWKPYSQLSEEMKEKDRKWARKALAVIREKQGGNGE